MPIEERMKYAKSSYSFDQRDLEACVDRIKSEGLNKLTYKNARLALVKAIGSKGVLEFLKREYENLGEEGRAAQAQAYIAWSERRDVQFRCGEGEMLCDYRASLHQKIVMIRKGFLADNGKPLTQREFAALIEYPINKYVQAEKSVCVDESPVEDELLNKLVMICHANPYWLFDFDCDPELGHYDRNDSAVTMGDEPSVYATPDVLLRWIKAGKPKETCWKDGR